MSDNVSRPLRKQPSESAQNHFVNAGIPSWLPQSACDYFNQKSKTVGHWVDGDNVNSKTFTKNNTSINQDRIQINQNMFQRNYFDETGRPNAQMVDDAFNGNLSTVNGDKIDDSDKMMILRSFLGIDTIKNGEFETPFTQRVGAASGVAANKTEFSQAFEDQWYARKLQTSIMDEEQRQSELRARNLLGSTVAINTSDVDSGTITPRTRKIDVDNSVTPPKPLFPEKFLDNAFTSMGVTDESQISRIRDQMSLNIATGGEAGAVNTTRIDGDKWIGAPPFYTHLPYIQKQSPELYAAKKYGSNAVGGLGTSMLFLSGAKEPGPIVQKLNDILKIKLPGLGGHHGIVGSIIHKAEPWLVAIKTANSIVNPTGDQSEIGSLIDHPLTPIVAYSVAEFAGPLLGELGYGGLAASLNPIGGAALVITLLYIGGTTLYDAYRADQLKRRDAERSWQERADNNGEWVEALNESNGEWTIQLGKESSGKILQVGGKRVEEFVVVPDGKYKLPVSYEWDAKQGKLVAKYKPGDQLIYKMRFDLNTGGPTVVIPATPGGRPIIPKSPEKAPPPPGAPTWLRPETKGRGYQDNLRPRPFFNFFDGQTESDHNSFLIDEYIKGKQNDFLSSYSKIKENNKDGNFNTEKNGPENTTGPVSLAPENISEATQELENIRRKNQDDLITYLQGVITEEDILNSKIINPDVGVSIDRNGNGQGNVTVGDSIFIEIDGQIYQIYTDQLTGLKRYKNVKNKSGVPKPIV